MADYDSTIPAFAVAATAARETRPPITRRGDFRRFWRETREELASVAPDPRLGVAVTSAEGARITPVKFASLDNCDIQGFLLTCEANRAPVTGAPVAGATHPGAPVGAPVSRPASTARPVVITTHGYNSQCNPVLEARHTVACNADLFCFDVRGFGLSRRACDLHPEGYILTGATDPRRSILRGAVGDYVRAAEVARLLGSGSGGVVFHGRSFGGALALAAQAVSQMADFLAVAVPTFGWAFGRRHLVKEGSGKEINDYLERHPSHEEAVMETMSYFDTVNVADRIGCRSIVGVGRRDNVVPAATVYAITNHMSPPPEIVELPVSHSDDPDERHWTGFDDRWTAEVATLRSSHQYSS
ncbi:MAG: hypothetical protein F4Y45_16835 [Acidobacteria bacterium]|nr:hypothetical protein [Acidobacteriota bacterium]MYJ05093.1 hypothetical protein [Acidobacteriota bacterium]